VIVPCYRYGHFLRECVESVLSQPIDCLRVLIIDDASPDNTGEVATDLARHDSRITLLKHPSNKGHIATYNEGIEWISSDYMLLLSADDYLLPGALSRAADLMDSHPEVGFTFGNAIQLEPSGAQKSINNVTGKANSRIVLGRKFIELSGPRNIVPTPTAVVRTQLQRAVGGYRPELTHSGDMEMWLRLAAHASVGMLKDYQAVYRRHAHNMSLTYTDDLLPDMHQRKAAVDFFFQACSPMLAGAPQLKRRFDWLLARDSVDLGSSAFNAGKMQSSQALCDFARRTCPSIRWSFAWTKLTCKRAVGYKACRILLRRASRSAQ